MLWGIKRYTLDRMTVVLLDKSTSGGRAPNSAAFPQLEGNLSMISTWFVTRTILVALFSLIPLAGSPSAASTWVLWPKMLNGDFVQAHLVYDTRQECERSLKMYIKNWDQKDNREWMKIGAGRAHPSHWRCLPDTIDPRQPREK